MNTNTFKYLAVLGLEKAHSIDDIRKAYILKIKEWHPDRYAYDEQKFLLANDVTKELNEAFDFLKAEYSSTIGRDYPTVVDIKYENETYTVIISSSNIQVLLYNTRLQILAIIFKNKSSYNYFNVPEQIFEAFLKAPSKGEYAQKNIYNTYLSKRNS